VQAWLGLCPRWAASRHPCGEQLSHAGMNWAGMRQRWEPASSSPCALPGWQRWLGQGARQVGMLCLGTAQRGKFAEHRLN